MKTIFIFLFCLLVGQNAGAQTNLAAEYGLDTSFALVDSCPAKNIVEYFSVNAKYPESSMSLLNRIRQKAKDENQIFKQNGFVSFRFTLNCKGQASSYRLFMLDEHYKEIKFEQSAIRFFYDFVRSLKEWKVQPTNKYGEKYSCYNAYLNFQIRDGKILSVAP
ncbi:MAG: hypothetical protein WC716_01925 [Chitinophagaceae bacterium]|jgi:hypothetical protein